MKHAHHQQTQQANVPSLTDLDNVELSKYVAARRQIHSPGGMTTWPRFPYSVRPLDVTWRPLQ